MLQKIYEKKVWECSHPLLPNSCSQDDMLIVKDEIFGPVTALMKFKWEQKFLFFFFFFLILSARISISVIVAVKIVEYLGKSYLYIGPSRRRLRARIIQNMALQQALWQRVWMWPTLFQGQSEPALYGSIATSLSRTIARSAGTRWAGLARILVPMAFTSISIPSLLLLPFTILLGSEVLSIRKW